MIDIIASILEFFSFALIGHSLLKVDIKKGIPYALLFLYLLPDIVITTFSLNISSDIDFIWCAFILVLFLHLQTKADIPSCLYTYPCAYIIIMLYQFAFVIFDSLLFHIQSENVLMIIGASYTLVVSILIYRFVNLNKLFAFLYKIGGKAGKFVIINLYLTAVIIVFYLHVNMASYYEIILFIVVAFAITIICNLLLSNQLGKIREQELRLSTYSEYLPVLEDLINAVRIRQHNYNNQLQAIAGLMYMHEDYTSLCNALEKQFKIAKNSDIPEYLLRINLPVVAGFLYQKSNVAKKHDKTLKLDFKTFSLTSTAPEYELIEMFGILIDNALDATPAGGTAYVTISCDGERICITTRNSGSILTPEDRKHFFTKGFSTKKDNKHSGLGLYQLNQLVKKYPEGSLSLWNEKSDILFQVEV